MWANNFEDIKRKKFRFQFSVLKVLSSLSVLLFDKFCYVGFAAWFINMINMLVFLAVSCAVTCVIV